MYPYLESIRVENAKAMHLDYHQERLENTFKKVYAKPAPFLLQEVLKLPEDIPAYKIKLRFLYNENSYKFEYERYQQKHIKRLKLLACNDIDYEHKKSERSMINTCLAQKGDCDDILIVKNGYISDTSAANILFFDGQEWLTPDTPLLKGTCRARLLSQAKIRETSIRPNDLSKFQSFCLINAMLDEFGEIISINNIIQ